MAGFNTDLPLKSLKAPMVFKVKNHDFTTDPAFSSLTRFDKKDGNNFNARLQRRIIREINSIKKMYYKHHYMFEFMEDEFAKMAAEIKSKAGLFMLLAIVVENFWVFIDVHMLLLPGSDCNEYDHD